MDVFGSSAVWSDAPSLSTPRSVTPQAAHFDIPSPKPDLFAPPVHDPFDEFDDFGEPEQATAVAATDDDDFGDFGDFADQPVPNSSSPANETYGFSEETAYEDEGYHQWYPLRLKPLPNPLELSQQVGELLSAVVRGPTIDRMFSGEGIRQVEGPTQLLVSSESREMYKTLFQDPPPPFQPPNWTRSRIRRQHLISQGIPVNLDEVNPHATGRALPTLNIITRPSSAPPRSKSQRPNGSLPPSRAGTPVQSLHTGRFVSAAANLAQVLGPKPVLDQEKITALLELDSDALPMLPIPKLEAHIAALRSQTVTASSLLTYLLQTREALQQDSEAYNNRIANLVNEAQRMKSGSKRTATPVKRATGAS